MADITDSPALKRKHEGKEPQRKRTKTEKKSKAESRESIGGDVAVTITTETPEEVKEVTVTTLPADGSTQAAAAPSSSWREKLQSKPKAKIMQEEAKDISTPKSKVKTTAEVAKVTSTPKSKPATKSKVEQTPKDKSESVDRDQKPSRKRNKKRSKNSDNKEQSQEADDDTIVPEDQEAQEASVAPTESTVNGNIEHTWVAAPSEKKRHRPSKGRPQDSDNGIQSTEIEQDMDNMNTTPKASQNNQISIKTGPTSPNSIKKPHKTKSASKKSPWLVSTPFGGWFLPQDPVFSSDEKFLILANVRGLQIYSTETSLLAHVLPVGSGVLTAYSLSSTKPTQVYIANSAGLITLWDWVDAKKLGRWDIGTNIRQIAVVTQPDTNQDLVYCHEVGSSHVINVHALRTRDQKPQTDLKRIFKSKSPISKIEVLLGGNVVIVACANSVVVGRRSKLQKTALQDFEYIWREFTTSTRITALCSYIQPQEPLGEGKRASQQLKDNLDIAIGDESGAIHLFEDLLSVSAGLEKSQKKREDPSADLESLKPKRLHWHREAVGSLKWSLDGRFSSFGLLAYSDPNFDRQLYHIRRR
jgi:NET1-associated nuclear protein 1 (U3 small nucleolar RNA-associated protein 17)